MESRNTSYLEPLDHLRAFAAVAVLLFHVAVLAPNRGILNHDPFRFILIDEGHVGVALFMVISGFILSHIVGSNKIHVARFYLNRILRIYPLYIFMVALGFYTAMKPAPPGDESAFLLALLPFSNLSMTNYGYYAGFLVDRGEAAVLSAVSRSGVSASPLRLARVRHTVRIS
jgi:peptidoglycan/LPS O-acetylase OafA/YrhL